MSAATATKAETKVPANKITKEDTYANGLRKAREDKGYSRISLAEALGLATGTSWNDEVHAEGKELAAKLKAIRALPEAEKPVRVAKPKAEKAPAAKAGAKVTAKKATAKAKPADATDLI